MSPVTSGLNGHTGKYEYHCLCHLLIVMPRSRGYATLHGWHVLTDGKLGEPMPWVAMITQDLGILRESSNGKLTELALP